MPRRCHSTEGSEGLLGAAELPGRQPGRGPRGAEVAIGARRALRWRRRTYRDGAAQEPGGGGGQAGGVGGPEGGGGGHSGLLLGLGALGARLAARAAAAVLVVVELGVVRVRRRGAAVEEVGEGGGQERRLGG